jgi:4-amino-4-deoxy-L-arabinose transferase-like glycosyltransferase
MERTPLNLFNRWHFRVAGVLILAAFLFGARLGERAWWSEEFRWAEIPREMLLSGDYWHPTINGKTYYDKPLGSYWLVLLTSWLTGSLDETSVRLPSVLSGILGVWLIMLIARRLYDDDTAILAGIILSTSFSYVFFSRHASTDVETVAGILAALWLYLRHEHHPTGWWTLWLWLVMALTSLMKGLLGFVLPLMVLGVYASLMPAASESVPPRSVRERISVLFLRNRWLFNGRLFFALPIALIVYFGPFLASSLADGSAEGLAMVWRENIRRFYDPVNHRGPIYLYLYEIILLMAPWSWLLPAALLQAHFAKSDRKPDRFILVYFWSVFLFFTLAASRRSYYLLPILPAGAVLVARLLTCYRDSLHYLAYRFFQGGFGLLAILVLLCPLALLPASILPPPYSSLPPLPHAWIFMLAWSASVVALVCAVWQARAEPIARFFTVAACSFMMYFYLFFLPAQEEFRTQKPFADAVKEHLGSDVKDVALFRNREIVYYLGQDRPLAEYFADDELMQALHDRRVRWLIVRQRDYARLRLPAKVLCREAVFPWESQEQTDGKLLLVEEN